MGGSPDASAAGWIGQAEAGKPSDDDDEEADDAVVVDGYGFGNGGAGAVGTEAAPEAGAVKTVAVGEPECSGKTGCCDGSLEECS